MADSVRHGCAQPMPGDTPHGGYTIINLYLSRNGRNHAHPYYFVA